MMIKFRFLFLLLLFGFFSSQTLTAQILSEKQASDDYFQNIHPSMQVWAAHFDSIANAQGIVTKDLGKSSGYMPYIRNKNYYDARRSQDGQLHSQQRWAAFEAMRKSALERNNLNPVADWKSIGPNKMEVYGGRVISHAFDPTNPDILYVGSATGGLWKSEDAAETWQPLSDQIPSTGVGAVAVNPSNTEVLLIGTGEGYTPFGSSGTGSFPIRPGLGVFRSENGGITWQSTNFTYQTTNDVSVMKLVWHPTDSNIVWMGATNGLWKSYDGGINWTIKRGDNTNHGTSICNDIHIHPTNPNILYASIEGNGIYRSTDVGETWQKLTNGLPQNDLNFISLDICRDFPDVLYANITSGPSTGFGTKGLFRTNDGGNTWNSIQNTPNCMCSPPVLGGNCQGWYNNIVAVSPTNPEVVWVGGITLWRTKDGGNTWIQRDRYTCIGCVEPPVCMTWVDQHDFAFHPLDTNTVFAFNDGGVAMSTDAGECFQQKNEGLVTAQFYQIASGRGHPNIVLGGMQDHGLQGADLSQSDVWDKWGFLDGYDVEVHKDNPNILYGTWLDGTYHKSTGGVGQIAGRITGGMNLNENTAWHNAPLRIHPVDSDTLLGVTMAKIYKSGNGGFSWQPVANATFVSEVAFSQTDPAHCYAAAWNPLASDWRFYHSSDGGENWSLTANAPGWRITDLKTSYSEAGTVYATRNSINVGSGTPHVFRSDDFGETWQSIQGDLPDIFVNGLTINPYAEENLYVATDLGVFTTIDGGVTWTEYNEGLPISIATDIDLNPTDTMLRIGTLGRGAWMSTAYMPSVSASQKVEAADFGFVMLGPNPFDSELFISYNLNKKANVELSILDVLGQKVSSIFQGEKSAGQHAVRWNNADTNLPTGIYFIRLHVDNQSLVRKIMKVD